MTYADSMPPPAAVPDPHSPWEACDHCQAPLDERQRYCVVCGGRRAHTDDPAARYFVAATRRARTSEAAPASQAARGGGSGIALALVLVLIPIAAALGVMAGRSGSGDGKQLVEALRAQKAPVVNVVGGGGTASDTSSSDGSATTVKGDDPNDANGKVISKTSFGTARQLTGAKVTKAQLEESRKALDHIVNSKGKAYVESQRDLPDQIVIP